MLKFICFISAVKVINFDLSEALNTDWTEVLYFIQQILVSIILFFLTCIRLENTKNI